MPGKELKKTLRKYSLASVEKRGVVDLRDYADVIISAVTEFAPGATVDVYSDHYTVKEPLTQSQSVRIGRRICESALGKHCIQLTLSKLFIGKEVVNENRSKSKQVGGHC